MGTALLATSTGDQGTRFFGVVERGARGAAAGRWARHAQGTGDSKLVRFKWPD